MDTVVPIILLRDAVIPLKSLAETVADLTLLNTPLEKNKSSPLKLYIQASLELKYSIVPNCVAILYPLI